MGVFPLEHQAQSLTIKYWLRLVNGTENVLLNECYNDSLNMNSDWLDGLNSLLNINGFGNVWFNPESVNKDSFHKIFKQSINDQFVQNLSGKLSTSNRLRLLNALTSDRSRYTRIYTIIAVGPLFVCLSVCVWPNSSDTNGRINFIFGTNVKHTPGIVQIFWGTISPRSRSSEVIGDFSFFVAM